LGIPPQSIEHVLGVVKAYSTRVGNGPFPTELDDDLGELLRSEGHEFGATTGRSRRCGWLDIPALRYSLAVNGVNHIALTKLDVLGVLDEIRVCTGYKVDGRDVKYFPADVATLNRVECVYQSFPGWKSDINGARSFTELPQAAQHYVQSIETLAGVPVQWISTSPAREDTFARSA
jgi:adenylosuccinate synthase